MASREIQAFSARYLGPPAFYISAALVICIGPILNIWFRSMYHAFWLTIEGLALSIILIYLVRRPGTLPGLFMNLRPMRYIGVLSYSFYLWQQLFVKSGWTGFLSIWRLPLDAPSCPSTWWNGLRCGFVMRLRRECRCEYRRVVIEHLMSPNPRSGGARYCMPRADDSSLREQLVALLKGGQAHATLSDAVADIPRTASASGRRAVLILRGSCWNTYASRFTIYWNLPPIPNMRNWNGPPATGQRMRRRDRTSPGRRL